VDVMLDDRNERPGAMFADWELIGVPHRVTIGDRALKEGQVEYQHRRDARCHQGGTLDEHCGAGSSSKLSGMTSADAPFQDGVYPQGLPWFRRCLGLAR
jgi:hypothetical protein